MPQQTRINARFACPCCGYPTLDALNACEICALCNWEDDGQGEDAAKEVWGGPNADYSLSEARKNFHLYRVMYSPDKDQRITGGDSALEYETKGLLMAEFSKLKAPDHLSQEPEAEILRLEKVLREETARKIREYERRGSHGA